MEQGQRKYSCISQLSPARLPHATDGDYHRNPQVIKNVVNKKMQSACPLPSESQGPLWKRGWKDFNSHSWWMTMKKQEFFPSSWKVAHMNLY